VARHRRFGGGCGVALVDGLEMRRKGCALLVVAVVVVAVGFTLGWF